MIQLTATTTWPQREVISVATEPVWIDPGIVTAVWSPDGVRTLIATEGNLLFEVTESVEDVLDAIGSQPPV